MKTLIADDDDANRLLLREMLAPYATDCQSVVDGADAVDAYKRAHAHGTPYRIVCLDMRMPRMGGLEALKEIRAYEESLGCFEMAKIVMVTAASDRETILAAFRHQCDAYIVKPYRGVDIQNRLSALGVLPLRESSKHIAR